MFLNQLSIGRRLAVVLGSILALFVISSALAAFKLQALGAELKGIVEDNIQTERAGADWLRNTANGVQRAAAIAKSSDASLIPYFAPATAAAIRHTDVVQKIVDSRMDEPHERALFDKVSGLRKGYLAARAEVSKLKEAGDLEGASAAFASRFEPTSAAYLAGVQEIVDLQRSQLDTAAKKAEALRAQTTTVLVGTTAVSLLLGAVLAWLLARSITRPLEQAVTVARQVAQGDLTGRIEATGRDETAQLLQALRAMNDNLARIVTDVRMGTDTMATASTQIASGNQDLSQRTEEQASSLQQTAASMGQLTSTVKNNSETARQATEMAALASAVAAEGGKAVGQVVGTMESITASSRRIADIIGVIDGIAFQTNILALNAAVEAARAGDQGRGFAVVASEVRTLAQRSADAAREIKGLITESVSRVEAGSQQVGEAGRTMQDIVTQVRRVSDLIGEISAASREQNQGISQVGTAVAQLDQVTQQNAALVEESAAAAESLKQQAARLVEAVSVFTVAESRGYAAA